MTPHPEGDCRCLLVNPTFPRFSFNNFRIPCDLLGARYTAPPLGLLTAAGLLPRRWTFVLIDVNVEPLTDAHLAWADVVCTGGMAGQRPGTLETIQRAKAAGKPVVVGGPDPTFDPDAYAEADFLVLGEGELSIPVFLDALTRGERSGRFRPDGFADLDRAVVPRYDLIDHRNYMFMVAQFSRGCPFLCEFCDVFLLVGRKPRCKSARQVLAELQAIRDTGFVGQVEFVDDNFIGNPHKAKDLLRAIQQWACAAKHPFTFSTEVSINAATDEDLLRLMRDASFRQVFIGVESAEQGVLKGIRKLQNVRVPVLEHIDRFYAHNMIVGAGLIVGFDEESDDVAARTLSLVRQASIVNVLCSQLVAVDGAPLAVRLRAEGRLRPRPPRTEAGIEPTAVGLNFETRRDRVRVLEDYACLMRELYAVDDYYRRALACCLKLRPVSFRSPRLREFLKNVAIFSRVCWRVGTQPTTRAQYWRLLAHVARRNPAALDRAVGFAVLFEHFREQSAYLVRATEAEISRLRAEPA